MVRTHTAAASAQILLFPNQQISDAPRNSESAAEPEAILPRGSSVVLCGTFRKDQEGLRNTFEHLKDCGFSVLSPSNALVQSEKDGFVYMQDESGHLPEEIEGRHLDAILSADFVWFYAPNGYVGPTGALEVGYAHANGIPVYSDTPLNDNAVKRFVTIVDSPSTVYEHFSQHRVLPPPPAVKGFQRYYRRAALQRGYTKENARDCLLLMVEEIGELARAIRKRAKLSRHGNPIQNHEAQELADVFIYVVHMANILKLDLSAIVQEKEVRNISKILHGK
jgi:NTP pyrophosphatase (non-canonical NTP hydrolase)/nucleoside 2-deoxyribosyltransferase